MKNRAAVSLGKKSADARRKKHGPKFNEHMRDLSQRAAEARTRARLDREAAL